MLKDKICESRLLFKCLGAVKPKGLNRTTKIWYDHLCLKKIWKIIRFHRMIILIEHCNSSVTLIRLIQNQRPNVTFFALMFCKYIANSVIDLENRWRHKRVYIYIYIYIYKYIVLIAIYQLLLHIVFTSRNWFVMQGPIAIILISWNVIFIWETDYWIRAMKRFALFDLLKSLYSDTNILSKYIPSLQKKL